MTRQKIAVLASGGLDSSILISHLSETYTVHPIYISCGLIWENQEKKCLNSFLKSINSPHIKPTTLLNLPMRKIYKDHWSITSKGIPDHTTPDESVYLEGRNLALITIASIWCSSNNISTITIGTLKENPFPDASKSFFKKIELSISIALSKKISIQAPFSTINKTELLQEFQHLPLHLTMTCLSPKKNVHCGQCNKCNERILAFKVASLQDKTIYLD